MTKQEVVIKIAKINRIIGEWKYRVEVGKEIESLSPELSYLAKWTQEIIQYIKKNPSNSLVWQIRNIGFTDLVEDYIKKHRNNTGAAYIYSLENYVKSLKELMSICDKYKEEHKSQYADLTEPLANKQVATLLQRAVNAGMLDSHFQPLPQTQTIQLRVIAFAVSSICGFQHTYAYFERLWNRENSYRISTCNPPRYKTDDFTKTKRLYPEVDFSELCPKHDIEIFYTPQEDEDKEKLFNNLIEHGYISPDTRLDSFMGIFDKEKFTVPVEWKKGQRQLAYFVHLAFSKYNEKTLWIKAECCFRIKGKIPHKQCLITGYSWIKRAGWLDIFDTRLAKICQEFNHVENLSEEDFIPPKRPIHTSKVVFHSSRRESDRKKMFAALLQGEYIDPNTTLSDFNSLFDDKEFKKPVKWIKSQSQLMYFVHIAFKTDNPYDLWKKCAACFCLSNGKQPNLTSLNSNFRILVKNGLLETYNTELKTIADKYVGTHKSGRKSISPITASKDDTNPT